MRVLLGLLAAVILVAGCERPAPLAASPSASPSASSPATPSPEPTPSPTPANARPHVFVVVMENASLQTALRSPVIDRLAGAHALAANYHAVGSPSLPNYLALTSGSTWGVSDDAYHVLPAGGLGAQLTAAGISWRAYMEGLTSAGCMRSPYPYALKHDPFPYYGGGCPANVVPLDALANDLASDTPTFVWISPGLCNDGHDCALDAAGAWLEQLVGRIVASAAWRDRGVLFIVWDEGDGADRTLVPLIAIGPGLGPSRVAARYDHYSLLAAIEDLMGVPRLGAAATADPLTELLSPRGR